MKDKDLNAGRELNETLSHGETDAQSAFDRWEKLEALPGRDDEDEVLENGDGARVREAFEAGVNEGRAAIEAELNRIRGIADSFDSALDSLDFRLADHVLNLALEVARQVVAGELSARPDRILDVVNLTLRQMSETMREARLLINPEDAAIVRTALNDALDSSRLRIVEDNRIFRGGCMIETPQGDLDATLQSRWRQVVLALGSTRNWID